MILASSLKPQVLHCDVKYVNDMGHYMREIKWSQSLNSHTEKMLESAVLKIVTPEMKKNVSIRYEKIPGTPYSARFFESKLPRKNIITNIFGYTVHINIIFD